MTADTPSARARKPIRFLRAAWETTALSLAMLLASRRVVQDFDVRLFDVGVDKEQLIRKLRAAIQLIAEVDPARSVRIHRDIRHFLVSDAASSSYVEGSRICILGAHQIRTRDEVRNALTIVHEAAHARIAPHTQHLSYDAAARVETVCVRQQIAFLAKLKQAGYSGTEAWTEHLKQQLGTNWWTDEAIFRRKLDMLEDAKAPDWLWAVFIKIFRPPGKE